MSEPGPIYGPPPQGFSVPPASGEHEELRKDATTWLVISGVSALACNGWCLSIAGGVMCFLAIQAADRGNVADGAAKLKWGKILTVSGIALGLVLGLALLLYLFVWTSAIAG
jgi:hypothetical protein